MLNLRRSLKKTINGFLLGNYLSDLPTKERNTYFTPGGAKLSGLLDSYYSNTGGASSVNYQNRFTSFLSVPGIQSNLLTQTQAFATTYAYSVNKVDALFGSVNATQTFNSFISWASEQRKIEQFRRP